MTGVLVAWLVAMTTFGLAPLRCTADDDPTTATKMGGITVYNDKRGSESTDIKTGPITTSAITGPRSQAETVTTATRIGNVTELTGSKGTKSTVVTVGPITSGQVNGKSVSVTRIGDNVAVGTNESGGTTKALQVGNQVVVQSSGNVSASEVRIIVRALQEPVGGQGTGDGTINGVSLIPFAGVEASGEVEVEVEGGQAFDIFANKNMREYGTFAVEQGILRIRCVGTGPGERVSRRVIVRMPKVEELTAGDGAQIVARNVTGEHFLMVSRGGGKIDLSGKVDAAQCRVSGGGQVLGSQLRTGRMSVRLEGDGQVHCRADQELVVMITGRGIVWCHGKPGLVTQKITGGGELRFEK